MCASLLFVAALAGQAKAAPDPALGPLATFRAMEVEDIDRQVREQHDAVLEQRARRASAERFAHRGSLSPAGLRDEETDLRYMEAREAELIALRAVSVYERDVLRGDLAPDPARVRALLLDLLGKQEKTAGIELDAARTKFETFAGLDYRYHRHGVERSNAEQATARAESNLLLIRLRKAKLELEAARVPGATPADPEKLKALEVAYLKAEVRFDEMQEAGTRYSLEGARSRHRTGLITDKELSAVERAHDAAAVNLATARKQLAALEPAPRPTAVGRR
ncbi:MAG TPA: hypothetical protein VG406_19285 [Isosphaeraceae bacterium]|jgi:hypothetical protein|nr:hypothetical protein [Isosphaeraceae bacterium]